MVAMTGVMVREGTHQGGGMAPALKAPRKKWTPDDFLFIRENYGKLTATEIARALQSSVPMIHNRASELDLKSRERILMEAKHDYIAENYKRLTHEDLAEKVGVKSYHIQNYCLSQGWKKRPHRPAPKWTADQDKYLTVNCKYRTLYELAERVGHTAEAVRKRLSVLKITDKPKRKQPEKNGSRRPVRAARLQPLAAKGCGTRPSKKVNGAMPTATHENRKVYKTMDTTTGKVPVRLGPRTVVYMNSNYSLQDLERVKQTVKCL
jgi:hypothetical protein